MPGWAVLANNPMVWDKNRIIRVSSFIMEVII
jgi:hypothetical protein